MTSRTNRSCAGENQKGGTQLSPDALQQRRQEALERYLAGDPVAVICQEMSGSKSWLSKWKKRHQFTEPDWAQEHSRRPERTLTKTPATLEAELIWWHQTLSPDGPGSVSADVIRDHLLQHSAERVSSRRTVYRILSRYRKEVHVNSLLS